MACFVLLTFFFDLPPLFNLPSLNSCMADFTSFCDSGPYFRAMAAPPHILLRYVSEAPAAVSFPAKAGTPTYQSRLESCKLRAGAPCQRARGQRLMTEG